MSPPGPPTDACALLDLDEVAAVSPAAAAGDGEGTSNEDEAVVGTAPVGAERVRYADCSWPAIDHAALYLTWVQPSPTPDATVWLERAVTQSIDPDRQEVEPLDLGEGPDGSVLSGAQIVADGHVLRVAGVLGEADLVTIEVLEPEVAPGSPAAEALADALAAALGRLS